MKTNKFNKEEYIDFIKFIIDKAFEGSGYSPVNDTTSQKTEIEQIKENIKYLNELLKYSHDEVIEFEIRKQIKYELSLLKTRINKYE